MIVALVGMPASGKGEASKIFQEHGFKLAYMRSVIEAVLGGREMPVNAKNMGSVGDELRRTEGEGAVARRLLPQIASLEGNVCIEGVRDAGELKVFKEALGEFIVVAIVAQPEKRYEWCVARGRADDVGAHEDFVEKDMRESSWGIDEAVAMADYKILNDSDLEAFRGEVTQLVEKILKGEGVSNSVDRE